MAEQPKDRFDYKGIDNVIHSRIRLAITALLASVAEADFVFLRERIGTTDGNLLTHLRKLEEAGYIAQEKGTESGRPRTVFSLTEEGRRAFRDYVHNLEQILGGS